MNDLSYKPIISDTTLLWIAISIGVLFLGVLFFDMLRRRLRKRRHSRHGHGHSRSHSRQPAEDWRTTLGKPIQFWRDVRRAFEQLARRRARRQRYEERIRLAQEQRRGGVPPQH